MTRKWRIPLRNSCSNCWGNEPGVYDTLHNKKGRSNMISREEILQRLRNQIENNRIIVGAGAGTGLSAKSAEMGGVDLIIIYNSGRFRMAGRGSLAGLMPYGDANQIVVDMGNEVLPIVKNTPVLAGVCGTDPFRLMDVFLKQLKDMGFSGVQNFPTVGLCDGVFRQNLEETGMGYVFNEQDAIKMAQAGADVLVAHVGLTTKGAIGAKTALSLDEAADLVQRIHDAGKSVNPDVMVICHGGPISEPEDAAYVLSKTKGIVGFFGASSVERLPTEVAISGQVQKFKAIPVR